LARCRAGTPDCGARMRVVRTWKPARERRGAGLCGWSC